MIPGTELAPGVKPRDGKGVVSWTGQSLHLDRNFLILPFIEAVWHIKRNRA